jgi:hypothetical protein
MRFWVVMTINMQIRVSQGVTAYSSVHWCQHFNSPTPQVEAAHSFKMSVSTYLPFYMAAQPQRL